MDATAREKSDRRGGSSREGQQAGDGSGETRSATRERKTSSCQRRQRSILDALFGRTGEGTSVGGRQVRGDRCSAQERTRRELGHPNGKKPDAMFASLLYRTHQAILTKVGGDSTTALERFVENSAHLEKNEKAVALQTWQVVAARANQPGAVRATRCFVVQSKKDETTKWIAAANGDPELSMALRVWQPKKTEAHEKVRK